MVDSLSPKARSERMSRIRGKNTKPEMLVRRLVTALGYRYRLHRSDIPGCPDLVFNTRKKAIFVHGCYWHRHPDPTCKLARLPKSRLDFWLPKLENNRVRDERNQEELRLLRWEVLVVWECQLARPVELKSLLREFLENEVN